MGRKAKSQKKTADAVQSNPPQLRERRMVFPAKEGLKVKVRLSVLEELLMPEKWGDLEWDPVQGTVTLSLSEFYVRFDPEEFEEAQTEPDGGGCLTFYFEK